MSVAGGKAEISQPRHYDDLYASNGPKMTDPDPNPFADCDFIVCYGGESGAPSRRSVAVKRTHSEGGGRVNSSINVMSLSLRPVMGLRLDKVVAPFLADHATSHRPL